MTTIYVDFNDIENGDSLTALLDHSDGPLTTGRTVLARDEDGNHCHARVVAIREGDIVALKLDWSTWNISVRQNEPDEPVDVGQEDESAQPTTSGPAGWTEPALADPH